MEQSELKYTDDMLQVYFHFSVRMDFLDSFRIFYVHPEDISSVELIKLDISSDTSSLDASVDPSVESVPNKIETVVKRWYPSKITYSHINKERKYIPFIENGYFDHHVPSHQTTGFFSRYSIKVNIKKNSSTYLYVDSNEKEKVKSGGGGFKYNLSLLSYTGSGSLRKYLNNNWDGKIYEKDI